MFNHVFWNATAFSLQYFLHLNIYQSAKVNWVTRFNAAGLNYDIKSTDFQQVEKVNIFRVIAYCYHCNERDICHQLLWAFSM